MKISDVTKWNTRVSGVYALGVWTMIVSYAYMKYTGRLEDKLVKTEAIQEPEDPNQVVHRTAHTKTIIVYKKDFVPYHVRISNFFKSFSGDSGSGDSDK